MKEISSIEHGRNKAIVVSHIDQTQAAVRDMVSNRPSYFVGLCDRLLPGGDEPAFEARSEVEARLVAELAGFMLMVAIAQGADLAAEEAK